MSERAPKHEQHKSPEQKHEEALKSHERERQIIEAGKQAKHESEDSLESIRSSIEKESAKAEIEKPGREASEEESKVRPTIIDRTLKGKAYQKELHRVRSHLSKPQKSLSKFIHAPVVEKVSEVSGKTVARPSGLLGGGLVAFLGTLALVIMTRYYGYEYNFFVFIALLIGGFFLGLLLELIIRAVVSSRR